MEQYSTLSTAITKLPSSTHVDKGSNTIKTVFLGLVTITPQLLNFHQLANIRYQIFKILKLEPSDSLFVRPSLIDAKVLLEKCSSWTRKLYLA
jgi:hypothetical protein